MSTLRHLIKYRISDKYREKLNGGRQLPSATSPEFKANRQAAWKISISSLVLLHVSASIHQELPEEALYQDRAQTIQKWGHGATWRKQTILINENLGGENCPTFLHPR